MKCNTGLYQTLKYLVLLSPLVSCVSVDLKKDNINKAEDVIYIAPKKPFHEFNSKFLDMAWKNNDNGNSISFLSECNSDSDPSLSLITKEILSSMESVEQISKKFYKYNHRKALRIHVKAEVDGIPSLLDLIVFKKNGCLYILTYLGVEKAYPKNKKYFDLFTKEFKAP